MADNDEQGKAQLAELAKAIGMEGELDGTSEGAGNAPQDSGSVDPAAGNGADRRANQRKAKAADGGSVNDSAGDAAGNAEGADAGQRGGSDREAVSIANGDMSFSEFSALPAEDMALPVAIGAYQALLAVEAVLEAKVTGGEVPQSPPHVTNEQARDMADFVRTQGAAVTPAVLAMHAKICGHREDPIPSQIDELAFEVFITVLRKLDAYVAAAKPAPLRDADKPVAPTPLDETIFEPVDDFFTPTF